MVIQYRYHMLIILLTKTVQREKLQLLTILLDYWLRNRTF